MAGDLAEGEGIVGVGNVRTVGKVEADAAALGVVGVVQGEGARCVSVC